MTVRWGKGMLLLAAWVVLLAACASTSLVNQWKSPSYSGAPLTKILVVGVSRQPSVRRVFEDEFVAQLRAAGVEAIPSYTLLPQDGPVEQSALEEAVTKSGAQAVLVTRLVRREQKTQVTGGFYQPAPALGFYGWYSSAWMGYYEPPTVYRYDVVTAETSLYRPDQAQPVWSGTTETTAPEDVRKETAGFAKVIIRALRTQHII